MVSLYRGVLIIELWGLVQSIALTCLIVGDVFV